MGGKPPPRSTCRPPLFRILHRSSSQATSRHALARVVATVAVVAITTMPAAPALANMANPLQAGDQVGEPSTALHSVAVEREDLVLDLRGLGQPPVGNSTHRLVQVRAGYGLRNTGPSTTQDLVFVAPGLQAAGASVALDGVEVPAVAGVFTDLPSTWRAPTSTPAVGSGETLSYQARAGSVLRFTLALAPGQHRVAVRYAAQPTTHDGEDAARSWQVGYVLAPARQWASFSGLHVTVQVPPGWLVATNPSLRRAGDTLTGTFDSVPADSLGITTQFPTPVPAPNFTLPVLVGGLALGAVAGWLAGAWLGRRRHASTWALPLAVVWGVALAALIVVAGVAALDTHVPEEQLSRTFTYGRGLPSLGLAGFGFLAAVAVSQLSAIWGRHRYAPISAPRPA
ncbi:MAG: hypothetical protein ACR2MY_01325 [Candidatus Dormibacteria bacterium]